MMTAPMFPPSTPPPDRSLAPVIATLVAVVAVGLLIVAGLAAEARLLADSTTGTTTSTVAAAPPSTTSTTFASVGASVDDSPSERFWTVVHAEHPTVARADAERLARAACAAFDEVGVPAGMVVIYRQVRNEPRVMQEQVGYIVGAGVYAFCPQHAAALKAAI